MISSLQFPPVLSIYLPVLAVVLILLEFLYKGIAAKYKIGAPVTERSSGTHRQFTVTGGGIVFLLAGIIYYFSYINILPIHFGEMLIGAIILGILSFIDDMHEINPSWRLFAQIVIVAMSYSWITYAPDAYLLILILGVGFINAYNFMDGISGMLVAYTLITLGTLAYVFWQLPGSEAGIMPFILSLIVATLVFGMFNFRKYSLIFCGDVGSIVMGYFILFLMILLIIATRNAAYIVFLLVYAIDTVLTILERLFRGENILTSHCSHLYQRFANQCGISHIVISMTYALIQLAINIGFLLIPASLEWVYVIIVTTLLVTVYFVLKGTVRTQRK